MSDNKIRIVLFGEGGVGKSALTIRYFQVSFMITKMTINRVPYKFDRL